MFRIGTGFDVHAFEPGNKIYLCGVEIPFDRSLAGHSDADVALHALTDAILGALALGDIGLHFPDTDEKWKKAESTIFLNWSLKKAKQRNLKFFCFACSIDQFKKIVESAVFHFSSVSGKCSPISPRAKAPNIASVRA